MKAEEEISEQPMINPFPIAVGKLVMLQGIARNQVSQNFHNFQSMVSMYNLSRFTPAIISSYQLHSSSGVARVDQLPGHQVAYYKLNMKICRRDIWFGGLAHTLVQIFKIMNIIAWARPSIARASARVGPGLATPLHSSTKTTWVISTTKGIPIFDMLGPAE